MVATLIESDENNGKIAYDCLVTSNPSLLSSFNNKISLKIIKMLAEYPSCALDIAKKLKVHEQKVYYHIKKLERAGIIYTISTEKRHGMIAKIYSVVSPAVAVKLFERGLEIKENYIFPPSQTLLNFFTPFIENGKLNAKIIIGDTTPHGEFADYSRESPYLIDFMIFLGKLLNDVSFPTYKLDVETDKKDLKNNLILVGNPKTNTIVYAIQDKLEILFNHEKESIKVIKSNNEYKSPFTGIILKTNNPFDNDKKILFIGGLRGRGVRSAVLAITKFFNDTFKNLNSNENFIKVVEGFDKDGDRIIDSIKILE